MNPFSAPRRQPEMVDVFGDAETWTRLPDSNVDAEAWTWQILPAGVIYHSYLAGVKEPRFASVWNHDSTAGDIWDIALGGRMGILRYGTEVAERAEGWELDLEGAAFPRLDREEERDLVAVDFRFGIPLTYGYGRWQTKLAYYHSCAHLGDQFMLRYPEVPRTDYSRDAIVWGNSYFVLEDLRLYAEVSWAFRMWGVAKPWEFQFGADYSPLVAAPRFPRLAVRGDQRAFPRGSGLRGRPGGPGGVAMARSHRPSLPPRRPVLHRQRRNVRVLPSSGAEDRLRCLVRLLTAKSHTRPSRKSLGQRRASAPG